MLCYFSSSGFTIQDRGHKSSVGGGRCENGLYVLDQNHHGFVSVVSSSKLRASIHLWHVPLDHPSFHTVDSLSKSGFISNSDKLVGLDSSLYKKRMNCNIDGSHLSCLGP